MADPGESSLSLSPTLVNSAGSATKNSFVGIVGQYTLLNRWKPRSRTESLWDKAVKNFREEWSSPDIYTALCNAKCPEDILSLLNVKLEESKKNRTTYKSRNGTEKPIADLLYNIAIYLKRFTGLVGTGVSVDPSKCTNTLNHIPSIHCFQFMPLDLGCLFNSSSMWL